jgi:TetR/AcrR family transcriptional repressor of nem operon
MAGVEPSSTRQRLIHAAVTLLWERSYTAAGVDELCRLAVARKGSFYHFFRTKADLAVAAIEYQWASARSTLVEPIHTTGAPGLDRLHRLIAGLDAAQREALTDTGALLGCPFGSLGQEMAHQDERIRAAVQTIFDAHCHYLSVWLEEAARARQIPAGDTMLRARQIFALLEGALLLTKVARDLSLFSSLCAAAPVIAGRTPGPDSSRSAAMPELL